MRKAKLEGYNLNTKKEQVVETVIYREDAHFYYCQGARLFPKNVWREV